MLPFLILRQTFLQLARNGRQVVTIFGLPILLQLAAMQLGLWLLNTPAHFPDCFIQNIDPFYAMVAITLIIVAFPLIWAATNWHRYILLNERPAAPRLSHKPLLKYTLSLTGIASLIISISYAAFSVSIPLLAALAETHDPGWASAIFFTLMIAINMLGIRFSIALPGAAIEADAPLSNALTASKGRMLPFLFLSGAVTALFSLYAHLIAQPLSMIAPASFDVAIRLHAALLPLLAWPAVIYLIAQSTVLYQHFAQGDPLR